MMEKDEKEINSLVSKGKKDETVVSELSEKRIKEDAANAVKISRTFLTILGVWNWEETAKWHYVVLKILVIVFYFGMGIRTIPVFIYMVMDEENISQKALLGGRILFGLMAAAKYSYLHSRRRDIEKCISHMEIDWLVNVSTVKRDIMMEYVNYGRMVITIFVLFTFSAASFYALLPIMVKKKASIVTIENVTQLTSVRTFGVPSHFGISLATETPVYEFLYTSQVVGTYFMHCVTVSCYSLAVVIVMHACAQLKILMEKLDNLVGTNNEEKSSSDFDDRLSDIICHHTRALRFIGSAEKMLREICLVDVGGDTIELCLVGYFTLLEWKKETVNIIGIVAWSLQFTTFLINAFSYCYIGELLTQECTEVGNVTYMIDWHRLPGKQPLAICLIIAMSQNPITLTAGGAIQMSLICFASVVKTSLGYINMLRTVMD